VNIYIGIDDTDNLETRGTGHHARMLGHSLVEAGLFEMHSVTRHQLLVDRRIPFTSHNSSACLAGVCTGSLSNLIVHAADFLKRESAFDADTGLCVALEEDVTQAIIEFGNRAKREILTMDDAFGLIANNAIYLEGFLNTRIGVIGSLAAVGLRAGGNDGRLLWTRNLRETTGDYKIAELPGLVGIDRVVGMNIPQPGLAMDNIIEMDLNETDLSIHRDAKKRIPGSDHSIGTITEKDFHEPDPASVIRIGEWCRPVMIGGMITLIAEKTDNHEPYAYKSASKDYIKSISE
jgi:hypothetical protein